MANALDCPCIDHARIELAAQMRCPIPTFSECGNSAAGRTELRFLKHPGQPAPPAGFRLLQALLATADEVIE
jgi:hypothetical protein